MRRTTGPCRSIAVLTVLAAAVTGFLAPPALAQVTPTAEARAICFESEAYASIRIEDETGGTFDVFIGDELVGDDIPGSVDDPYMFGPLVQGDHPILVTWNTGPTTILDVLLTVANCGIQPTTTETTAEATSSTVRPSTDGAQAAPRYTG